MLKTQVIRKLIREAAKSRKRAYAPYSKFLVGAAALGGSGKIYGGCNVENASYGLTICAERTAIFNAVAAGEKKIRGLAVLFHHTRRGAPCGACRQVIREFGKNVPVVLANLRGGYDLREIEDILPGSFGPEDLR
ncbi:cytidine deaminase [bacterium]|nr:cytidine deaminase [bacterium]